MALRALACLKGMRSVPSQSLCHKGTFHKTGLTNYLKKKKKITFREVEMAIKLGDGTYCIEFGKLGRSLGSRKKTAASL